LWPASFTRSANDVKLVRDSLRSHQGGDRIQIISKIENQEGLDNFDEILASSDAIMVARGDMGVEISLEKVVIAQKMMIRKSNLAGKPVITATQMLESMITSPRPTRAECTDVANAVFDGTDCVMLSGETAKGSYPIRAVEFMNNICITAERAIDSVEVFSSLLEGTKLDRPKLGREEAIASSAVQCSSEAAAIVVISRSGASARRVAKYKPGVPVLMLTPLLQTARQAMLSYGLYPFFIEIETGKDTFQKGIQIGKELDWIKNGDEVVLVKGVDGVEGSTNSLQIISI